MGEASYQLHNHQKIIQNYPKGKILVFNEQYRCEFAGGNGLPDFFNNIDTPEGMDLFTLVGTARGTKIAQELNRGFHGYSSNITIPHKNKMITVYVSPMTNGSREIHSVIAVFDEKSEGESFNTEILNTRALKRDETESILFNAFKSLGDEIHVIDRNYNSIMSNLNDNEHSVLKEHCSNLNDNYRVDEVFETGQPKCFEVPGNSNPSSTYEIRIYPIHTRQNAVKYAVIHIKDISRIKQTENKLQNLTRDLEKRVLQRTRQLESANKELEAFSYSASHDLRAPLRGIDGFSQALLEDYGDSLDGPALDYLKRIRTGTQRMASIIEDLISLSRITRFEMNHQYVNLSKIVTETAENLTKNNPDRNVEFKITEGLYTNGDHRFLRLVMENLIENAWKYTGKKEKGLIEFGSFSSGGKRIFFVKDNGNGFDMKYADQLFAPFRRLHNSRDFPGTGIGLATVMRIIHRHGGSIWAQGEVDKGAVFYFTLWDMDSDILFQEAYDEG